MLGLRIEKAYIKNAPKKDDNLPMGNFFYFYGKFFYLFADEVSFFLGKFSISLGKFLYFFLERWKILSHKLCLRHLFEIGKKTACL